MNKSVVQTGVLAALASEPQHGYAILRDIERVSDGRLSPPVGSLYRVIDALVRDGLVELDRTEVVDGRHRKYYRLTTEGRRDLEVSISAMTALATTARRRLRVTSPSAGDLGGAPA